MAECLLATVFKHTLNRGGQIAQSSGAGSALAVSLRQFRTGGNQVFLASFQDSGELQFHARNLSRGTVLRKPETTSQIWPRLNAASPQPGSRYFSRDSLLYLGETEINEKSNLMNVSRRLKTEMTP
jgi:hypothetical protein